VLLQQSLAVPLEVCRPGEQHLREHPEHSSEEQLLEEVRRGYGGKVVAGHDLDIF
jgi:hypothetical protein